MKAIQEILYVEDNPADVLLLKSALEIVDFRPRLHIAQDGVEGLNFLTAMDGTSRVTIDLLLLDLNLPKKNGFEVLKEVREHPDLKNLFVITYSGSINPEDFKKARGLNANECWQKPQDFNHALNVARKLKEIRI